MSFNISQLSDSSLESYGISREDLPQIYEHYLIFMKIYSRHYYVKGNNRNTKYFCEACQVSGKNLFNHKKSLKHKKSQEIYDLRNKLNKSSSISSEATTVDSEDDI